VYVLCHSDLHAANILISKTGDLYIVDWDNPIFAPVERDLMFIGGAQYGARRTSQEEVALFYHGYGPTRVNPKALAYYRYERIVQDIAEYCKQLLLTTEGGKDREQSLIYIKANFLPNNTIDIAYKSDET
jgi:spectinomycin phosphotransferase